MDRFSLEVLNETVQSAGPPAVVLTSDKFDASLGVFDQLAVDVNTDNVTGFLTSLDLVVDLLHSADGVHYNTKTSGFVPSWGLNLSGNTIVPTAFDDGTQPSLGYVKLRLTLTPAPALTAFTLKVNVKVMANDDRERDFAREQRIGQFGDCTQRLTPDWEKWIPPDLAWLKEPPWNGRRGRSTHAPTHARKSTTFAPGHEPTPAGSLPDPPSAPGYGPPTGAQENFFRVPCALYPRIKAYRHDNDPAYKAALEAELRAAVALVHSLDPKVRADRDAREEERRCEKKYYLYAKAFLENRAQGNPEGWKLFLPTTQACCPDDPPDVGPGRNPCIGGYPSKDQLDAWWARVSARKG